MIPLVLATLLQMSSPLGPHPPAATPAGEIEIVLFSDFQCPFCAQFSQPFRQLQINGIEGARTTVQFKSFPLPFHAKAQLAHQAALAAAAQGKFWEMHDLLFANQRRADRDDLIGYASRLGLDLDRFQQDMDSVAVKKTIQAELAEGERRHISGTPTFYVNGKEYVGARSFEQLKQIVLGAHRRTLALTEIGDDLLSRGPSNAPVTVELFADLQSPVTPPAMHVLDQVLARYPTAVRIQFRNFPLPFHAQAGLAHEAATTAARNGRFWEFVGYILEHQGAQREQDLIELAGRLGMEQKDFAEALQQHRYAPRVEADMDAGKTRGVRGSPVIVINGKQIDGVPSLEAVIECIEAALTAKGASPASNR